MSSSKLAPLAVVRYSKDFLIAFVRHQTGWDQRSEVSEKDQLNYLCNYLEVDHINARTIVVENEYIDRHYLEDYSEYYARCFPSHPRKCSRVHFFSNEFDEYQFTSALENNDQHFLDQLNQKYLGFAVIRPIPHTFLAKLCLKRYEELITNPLCKLIAKSIHVSLFGVSLELKSAAFLEQDKVVSACATSALWMFFNASDQEFNGSLPSPSSITKSATGSSLDGIRTFPTSGLTPTQVARSLNHFGFAPTILEFESDWLEFKEILYGYISNNIPILVAGSVYKKKSNGEVKHEGKHLICVVGYRLSNEPLTYSHEMLFNSHSIEKIYVHDDRYGPYLRVSMDPVKFFCIENKERQFSCVENVERQGLELAIQSTSESEYFVPDMLIFGLYHKIRLSYFEIRDIVESLFWYLKESKSRHDAVKEKCKPADKYYYKTITDSIDCFIRGTFDIALTTNTKIKEDLRSNEFFLSYNGAATKSACLLQSMPKYIWRCRVSCKRNSDTSFFSDILFDATEIAQGQVLVGYISYADNAERVWKHVEDAICSNIWEKFSIDAATKEGIRGFLKFFTKNKMASYLNSLYGPLGHPRRKLKQGETDNNNNIVIRSDVQVIRPGNIDFLEKLEKTRRFIWVINEFGALILGEDIIRTADAQGHPTLVDEQPARLGGELYFNTSKNSWVVNLKSGTYSAHLKLGSNLRLDYLQNVIRENFKEKVLIDDEIEKLTPSSITE